MVYFGNRRFRGTQRGFTTRDKIHMAIPLLLLIGVLLIVSFLMSSRPRSDESQLPVRVEKRASAPRGQKSHAPEDGGPPGTGVIDLSPNEHPNQAPAPFAADAQVLAKFRDDVEKPGDAEQTALIYLFHRWRNGPAEPVIDEVPEYTSIPAMASKMRGKRYQLYLTLVENPQPRYENANASGVRRYWEAFGKDAAGHLHRLIFIEKPGLFPEGTDVVAAADFLGLYKYQTNRETWGRVPEWVAERIERYQSALPAANWNPFLWVVAISGVALLALLVTISWKGRGEGDSSSHRMHAGEDTPASS